MPLPTERYRDGYEKGENRTLGSAAAEVMFAEMLRDDPGGHFNLNPAVRPRRSRQTAMFSLPRDVPRLHPLGEVRNRCDAQ